MKSSYNQLSDAQKAQHLYNKIVTEKLITNSDIVEYGLLQNLIQEGQSAKDVAQVLIGDGSKKWGEDKTTDAGYAMQKIIKANTRKKFGDQGIYKAEQFGSRQVFDSFAKAKNRTDTFVVKNPAENLEMLNAIATNHMTSELLQVFNTSK